MVKKIDERAEKKKAIEICDCVFINGLCKRKDFPDIFNKIDKNADFFISYKGDVICGYAAMYNNDMNSMTAFITMIGVREEFQHKHIGSELIVACIKSAKSIGMKSIRLEVLKSNIKAIAFYKKNGFVYEKDCTNNSVYMELLL